MSGLHFLDSGGRRRGASARAIAGGGISSGAGRWAALSNRGINGARGGDINLASFVVVLEAIWQLYSPGNELLCARRARGRAGDREGLRAEFPASLCLLISSGLEPESRNESKHTWRRHSARGRVTALNGKTISKYLNPRPGEGGSPWETWRRAAEGWWRAEGQLSLLPPARPPFPSATFLPLATSFCNFLLLDSLFSRGLLWHPRPGGREGRAPCMGGGRAGGPLGDRGKKQLTCSHFLFLREFCLPPFLFAFYTLVLAYDFYEYYWKCALKAAYNDV